MWRLKPLLLTFLVLSGSGPCLGADSLSTEGAPFRPGEKLSYDLYWELIHAGSAELEVSAVEEYEGASAYQFVLTVRTNSVIDRFYKVRDRLESFTDRPMRRSLLYRKKQQEGKHRRDIVVTFNWDRFQAEYSNFGKKEKPVAVVEGTFDPLSVLYAYRLMPLREQAVVEVPVSDGKKAVMGKVRVTGREKIRVKDRDYHTWVLEPDLKDLGGVFRKSKGAKVRIWVTDDERRVPVKLTSKVVVGNFVAELTPGGGAPLNTASR
jgi:hypothetical protein